MSNISRIRRNIMLLLGGAIVASTAMLALITPSVIRFSPQAVQEAQENLYIFAPLAALLLLAAVYVYLQPISQLGRYLRQNQAPPPELAQQARTRAFSAPFYLFFVPVILVGLITTLSDLYGLVAKPGSTWPC